MSNLYEIKAIKYKLKYEKLKQEYIGEGGYVNQQLQKPPEMVSDVVLDGHCETSPPIRLDDLNISQIYPKYKKVNLNKLYTNKYIGKLYWEGNGIDEYNNYKKIKKYDPNNDYTSEIVFVGKIKESSRGWLSYLFQSVSSEKNTFTKILSEKLPSCEVSRSTTPGNVYIIRKTIGKPLEISRFIHNDSDIKQILESLKESIINFIAPLYDKGYVLCIDKERIFLKNNKVYYNYNYIYKYDNTYNNNLYVMDGYYPYIIKHFNEINEEKITKNQLIDLLLSKYKNYEDSKYPNFTKNINIEKYTNFVNNIFSSLQDGEYEYDINEIFETYILPIAKNSDIYALCNLISDICINHNELFDQLNEKTFKLIVYLNLNAYNNLIDGPRELSTKLDEIIQSLIPS
jgi:hypothetical protein